jgi:hypothetical protein
MVTIYTKSPVKQAYTKRCPLFWVITQQEVVMCYILVHCREKYMTHSQGSRIQIHLDSWGLRVGSICGPETFVKNCHYSLRNNPEERSSYLLCGVSPKSRKVYTKGLYEIWFRLTSDRHRAICLRLYGTWTWMWVRMVYCRIYLGNVTLSFIEWRA